MTPIEERAAQLGPEKMGPPLTDERPVEGCTIRAYENAILIDVPGAGVYALSEATVAEKFRPLA